MAVGGHLVNPALIELYRRFDDQMWASVANVGLLWRARKDLTGSAPELVSESDELITDSAVIALGGQRVRLDSTGPSGAVCDCPATGICRHIVAAGLWLGGLPIEAAQSLGAGSSGETSSGPEAVVGTELPSTPATSAIDELLAFDRTALIAHAGRAGYRWARDHVVDLDSTTMQRCDDGSLRVVLGHVALRYPGGSLATMTPERGDAGTGSTTTGELPRFQVCAVLSCQRAVGVSVGDPGPLEPTPAERRHQAELHQMYGALRVLLCDTVLGGTAHVSSATVERCDAAAINATRNDHYRLAASLRRLADAANAIVTRSADGAPIIDEMAWCFTLLAALEATQHPTDRLLGSGRTGYHDVGELELIGLGAYPWRSASGYVGVTAAFWCAARTAFLTFTDTRPATVGGFDPISEYRRGEPVWPGLSSIAAATGSRILLSGARLNEQGRLSRTANGAEVTPLRHHELVASLPVVSNWAELAQSGLGRALLDPPRPNADWVIIAPDAASAGRFDPVTQTLTREVFDHAATSLALRLRYNQYTEHAIGRLDTTTPIPKGALIVGRRDVGARSALSPVSIINPDPARVNAIDALHFDPPSTQSRRAHLPDSPASAVSTRSVAPSILDRFEGWLERVVERGDRGRADELHDELILWHERLHQAGLSVFANTTEATGTQRLEPRSVAELLLRSHALVLQLRRMTPG